MENHKVINNVISCLKENNFDRRAVDLQKLAKDLDSKNLEIRKEAAYQIQQRCHKNG